jgi:hypothetical protein
MIEIFGVTFWVPGLVVAAAATVMAFYLKAKQ